jgi:hypothetical protein
MAVVVGMCRAYRGIVSEPVKNWSFRLAKAFGSIFLPDVTNGSATTALWTGV